MGPLEIFVISAGIIIIIASFIAGERGAKNNDMLHIDMESIDRLMENRKKKTEEDLNSLLQQYTETAVVKADNQMAQICNEKIMAVNEFSEQILEKLDQNHKEVVFLYDMLNEKESEMKKLIQKIDKSKLYLEESLMAEKQEQEPAVLSDQPAGGSTAGAGSRTSGAVNRSRRNHSKKESMEYQKTQAAEMKRQSALKAQKDMDDTAANGKEQYSRNDRILALYREGKSVLEISRILGQGQGEVKLVIDLYQGRGV